MTKISNNLVGNMQTLKAFAEANKAKFELMPFRSEPGDAGFWIEKEDWAVEVVPYDGGAHVNGYKSIRTYSTHIESFEELTAAIERLLSCR